VKNGLHARRAAAAAVALGALWVMAAAPLPNAWRHWLYSRAIELAPTNETRLASVAVPPGVYAHAQTDLADVRLIDNFGTEVPYAPFLRLGASNSVAIPTQILENSFAPGHYTQIVLQTGKKVPFDNAVRIDTTETEFIEWVEVAASDDARVWRVVQPRAPIFRFQREGRSGTQTIPYSENNALYLRIRILDGKAKFPVTGASILYQTSETAERTPFDAELSPDPNPPADSTSWIADVGQDPAPLVEVRFDVPGPSEFIRSVKLLVSSDRENWSLWTSGEIYRYRQSDHMQEQLVVSLPYGGTSTRYWRVEILNGNDPPLAGVTPHFYTTPRHVVFEQQPGHTYRLLYGDSRASAPQYDLERRLDSTEEIAAVPGQAGPEEENSNYSDPRPWTEQRPFILWIVVGLAAVLLGYAAIRALKRPDSSGAGR
jgi:Protein of unknown function (DUF3999)